MMTQMIMSMVTSGGNVVEDLKDDTDDNVDGYIDGNVRWQCG